MDRNKYYGGESASLMLEQVNIFLHCLSVYVIVYVCLSD